MRTGKLLDPIALLATRDILVVDVTREEGGIDGTQVERATGLQRIRGGSVDETRQLECHKGRIERAVVVGKRLPEGGRA